jgi:tetratricopeptide (TPR) repeat protein
MATALPIFVSHSHQDSAFCRALVTALRDAGADVWYDEHNLESGQLLDVIQRELGRRKIFVVILSKHAFGSTWVRRETVWAYSLYDRDPTRIILPITAGHIERGDFSPEQGWLFLEDFKRIEAPGLQPFPLQEAVERTLRALSLTPAGAAPTPTVPQPSESVDELIAHGKALSSFLVDSATEYFVRATELAPDSFDAWANLGHNYGQLERWQDSLAASNRALAIDDSQAFAWHTKCVALQQLQRHEEALAAFNYALVVDPVYREAWIDIGKLLQKLQRNEDALDVYERALALDEHDFATWIAEGNILSQLDRYEESLDAYNRALAEKPSYYVQHDIWVAKSNLLNSLQRYEEALTNINRALSRDKTAAKLGIKVTALRGLGQTVEAEKAERSAKALETHLGV